MRASPIRANALKTSLGHRSPRTAARTLALGALAAALIATTALPAFAAKPDNRQHGGQRVQRQEQEASASGKRRGNKKKSVKKTFASDGAIAIPAEDAVDQFGPADPYPSSIDVAGFKKARITDVNLSLRGLSHTFPPDVNVLLVAPGGRNAVVMEEVGFEFGDISDVANITLRLDDEAATALPAEDLLTDGSFRPFANGNPSILAFPAPAPALSGSVALSTFDGINPNGEWQLFIFDDALSDSGSLANGWTLEITAKSKVESVGNGKKKR